MATIVVAAGVLEPVPFAGLALALALSDVVRTGLLAFDVSGVRLLAGGAAVQTTMSEHLVAKISLALLGSAAALFISLVAFGTETSVLLAVVSVGTAASSISGLLLVRRQAVLALGSAAWSVAWTSLVGASIGIAGVLATLSPLPPAIGFALSDILLLAVLSPALREAGRPALGRVRALVRSSATLLAMQLSYITQFRVGAVILGVVGTPIAVSEYTVATRLMEGFIVLASAVTATTLPLFGAAFATRDDFQLIDLFRRSYRTSLVIIAPLVTVITLSAPLWMSTVFPRYPDATGALFVVGLSVVVYFANSQTTALLNARHRDGVAAGAAVVGVLTGIAGTLLLAPFGAVGAAMARLSGELTRALLESAAIVRAGVSVGSISRSWLVIGPPLIGIALAAALRWGPVATGVAGLAGLGTTGLLWIATRRRPVEHPGHP